MRQMTELSMRQADGGYFRRGVQIYKNRKWVTVFMEATRLPSGSKAATMIKVRAQRVRVSYMAKGYKTRYI